MCLFGFYRPASDDMLVQPFDVYVQILLSQALEPGFLSALQDQPGTTQFLHQNILFVLSLGKFVTRFYVYSRCMLTLFHN